MYFAVLVVVFVVDINDDTDHSQLNHGGAFVLGMQTPATKASRGLRCYDRQSRAAFLVGDYRIKVS